MSNPFNVAIVCTSADLVEGAGEQKKTGVWYEELAAPYYVFKDLGNKVQVLSIKGGPIPLDPTSVDKPNTSEFTERFNNDEEALKAIKESISIQDFDFSAVDAVYFPGGHGTVVDFFKNNDLVQIVNEMYNTGKLLAAVCHGVLAFVGAKKKDGEPLLKGASVTGFSTDEEKQVNLTHLSVAVTGSESPEDALKKEGAKYSHAQNPWESYVVTDGILITGQNPASSKDVAEAVIAAYDEKTKFANKLPKGFEKA